ncbi:porin [Bowmanella dokdonensis]|uniref:Carbohydrate porin n=1 Tax=Bowmanella dokdonensis TaxID=751969 RepID=A0A939DQ23_9ALTE|nr:porin [Bowmanella dokdonensis]MBN7826659.1 carbohydrate porin [Bowmanella dokdonensis]
MDKCKSVPCLLALFLAFGLPARAQQVTEQELAEILQQMEVLKARVEELEKRLKSQPQQTAQETRQQQTQQGVERGSDISTKLSKPDVQRLQALEKKVSEARNPPIRIGGAVRFQYSFEDYDADNRDRTGDLDFDIFRVDFNGQIGDVILAAQYRWFQYMDAVQKAYVGYNLSEHWQAQLGIINLPFGNLPYNSHNYFFSSNFYVGLEDNPEAGVNFRYRSQDWEWDLGFYKSDEQGGVDGYVSDRTARYAPDAVGVRLPGEGIYQAPTLAMARHNTFAVRGARNWQMAAQSSLQLGLSAQAGQLHDEKDDIGEQKTVGLHGRFKDGPWEWMGMISHYDYDLPMANDGIVVGSYGFFDTIPLSGTLYTANVAYDLPVVWGPVSNLRFHDNFSLMTGKPGDGQDSFMNVLGMAVTAGGLYTYFDLVSARNHPFIGGSLAGQAGETNTRFNINFGYYF